jgi:hypothetical protein
MHDIYKILELLIAIEGADAGSLSEEGYSRFWDAQELAREVLDEDFHKVLTLLSEIDCCAGYTIPSKDYKKFREARELAPQALAHCRNMVQKTAEALLANVEKHIRQAQAQNG